MSTISKFIEIRRTCDTRDDSLKIALIVDRCEDGRFILRIMEKIFVDSNN